MRMQNAILTILIASTCLFGQTRQTAKETLGEAKVRAVLDDAVNQSKKQLADTYLITAETLDELRSNRLSKDSLDKLQSLKGQEFKGSDRFFAAVQGKIEADEALRFKSLILNSAERRIVVKDDFISKVGQLLLQTPAPREAGRGEEEEWLREGVHKFIIEYTSYLKARHREKTMLVVGTEDLEKFLSKRRKKCGELPCSIPPCCGDCDPCKSK